MKVIVDTNVIISAILTEGHSFDVIQNALYRHELYYTDHILKELERIFSSKFPLPKERISQSLSLITKYFRKGISASKVGKVCRDPDDDCILADAVANGIECIITGDKDLLVLKTYKGIRIIQPKDYWNV